VSADLRIARAEVPWRRVGEEILVARPGREEIESLTGPAAMVWLLVDSPTTVAGMLEMSGAEGVGGEEMDDRLREQVEALRSIGLLHEVVDGGR
jgi:hypothetical protein